MSQKPELSKILAWRKVREEAEQLYELAEKMAQELILDHNDHTYYYEMDEESDGKKYCKFAIKNNILALRRGEKVWTNTSVSPYRFTFLKLKNKPKDL